MYGQQKLQQQPTFPPQPTNYNPYAQQQQISSPEPVAQAGSNKPGPTVTVLSTHMLDLARLGW